MSVAGTMIGTSTLINRRLRTVGCAAAVSLLLASCSGQIIPHGNAPDEAVVSSIKPGITSQGQVAGLLGSPSTVAAFDSNVWYYISKTSKSVAFLKPQTIDQQVVEIRFDDSGLVEEVLRYDMGDQNEVDFVARETPTAGHNLTIIEQLFGNIGRFNTEPRTGPAPGV